MQVTAANAPYRPWGTAEDVFYSRERNLMVSGRAGTGKSRAIIEKNHYLSLKYPKLRSLWIRATRKSLTESAMVTFEDHVLPEGDPLTRGAGRANRSAYHYPNGSTIVLAGLDNAEAADRVMSTEWDFIYVQEAIEIEDEVWDKLDMRLRNGRGPYHQLIGDTNPGAPTHWIYQRAYEEQTLPIIEARFEDNPRFYDHKLGCWTPEGEDYIGALSRKKGHLRERYFAGKWVQPEGSRWPDLDEKIHCYRFRERFPYGLPAHYPVHIGGDYGLAAPFAAIWFATDEDGNSWAFRERYQAGLVASKQAEIIRDATGQNEKIHTLRLDPAMWDRFPAHEGPTDKTAAAIYREVLGSDPRFSVIEKGYGDGYSRMNGEQLLDSLFDYQDGRPNLYIDKDLCPNLWKELCGAKWPKEAGKEQMDSKNCADHAITATIYGHYGYVRSAPTAIPVPTPEQMRSAQLEEIKKKDERDLQRLFRTRRR